MSKSKVTINSVARIASFLIKKNFTRQIRFNCNAYFVFKDNMICKLVH